MRIAILSGTSRAGNNTIRLARAIENLHVAKNDDVTVVDFRGYDLPFFNGAPIDENNPTDFQKHLLDSWSEAELVYILSPEYNWLITPELSNMTNHFSGAQHTHLYHNKVFAFAGVSSGIGGRLPTMQLSSVFEKLIFYLSQESVCSPNKFEAHYTPQELDENGAFLKDSGFDQRLKNYIDYNSRLCLRFRQ